MIQIYILFTHLFQKRVIQKKSLYFICTSTILFVWKRNSNTNQTLKSNGFFCWLHCQVPPIFPPLLAVSFVTWVFGYFYNNCNTQTQYTLHTNPQTVLSLFTFHYCASDTSVIAIYSYSYIPHT